MLKFIGTLIALGGLFLGGVETASAHGWVQDSYDPPNYYRVGIHRGMQMPYPFRYRKEFRKWYYRSALRHNRQLTWWQLYEIYRWESRYKGHRHYPSQYSYRYRSYDWYRRYWRDYEHERRDRRHSSRRETRNEMRRRHGYDD